MIFRNRAEKFKILVVEDDFVSRLLLGEILRDLEMLVDFAHNGQQAIDMVKEDNNYTFILMDIKMPVMDGYEAFKLIREFGYSNPVIAQTAYASKTDSERIYKSGFDGYITKPIVKSKLIEIIKGITK